MKKKCYILFAGICLYGLGCTTKPVVLSRYLSTEKNIQFLVEKGKSHWEKRVNPKDAERARLFLSKAYYQNPNNGEVSALYSRVCFFIGYYLEEDPANRIHCLLRVWKRPGILLFRQKRIRKDTLSLREIR